MTELFEPTGELDWRLAAHATGLLADFNAATLLTAADVHVAARMGVLGRETDERVLLAVALAVRAVRRGSVCLDLAAAPETVRDLGLDWPDHDAWVAAVEASPLLEQRVIRWEHGLLYLDRYHRLESQVCDDLLARTSQPPPSVDPALLESTIELIADDHFSDEQRTAAAAAAGSWTTVLTGGPGTGKTTTVARMLVLLADQAAAQDKRISVALAAPTGKAATRLQEAVLGGLDRIATLSPEAAQAAERVGRPHGLTLHRLLGWRFDNSTRFRHDRGNRLKYDVVVVDESSMVELTLMGRLLEAIRPESRLILVGDPQQLTSVGAGAVLSDLVAGYDGSPASPVSALVENHRSEQDIRELAAALRVGDADGVLDVLRSTSDQVSFVEATDDDQIAAALRPECVTGALEVLAAAQAEEPGRAIAGLDRHRLLCAHREGPYGVRRWNHQVERWLVEETGGEIYEQWYVGRPLLVTSNDYTLDLYNGEIGVVVRQGRRPRAFFSGSDGSSRSRRAASTPWRPCTR